MTADRILAAAEAAEPGSALDAVTAVHSGVVLDVECSECGVHIVILCDGCGIHDADDLECPTVVGVVAALEVWGPAEAA